MSSEQFPDAEPIQCETLERFPGYRFGSDGSVWTCLERQGGYAYLPTDRWRRMKLTPAGKYLYVSLKTESGQIQRRIPVHRLILEAFNGPCPDGMECRHFPDGDGHNNSIGNLRWGTRSENFMDKWAQGTMPHGASHHRPTAALNEDQVRQIRSAHASRVSQVSLAKQFGVSPQNINAIIKRRSWQWI